MERISPAPPRSLPPRLPHSVRGDLVAAIVLAVVLGLVWTARDWPALSALRLPDTDDVMRLQQVRDWLGGQAWSDLVQHRLGPGTGTPMHWSRIADLGPAALLTLASPLVGVHAAELIMVIVWPTILFAVALLLVAWIARALEPGAARTAIVIAAIAYPATTIFAPGRIDHHGLQLVLLLGATLVAIGRPTFCNGAILGALAATSLMVGLETMPFFIVLGAGGLTVWVMSPTEAGPDRHILGLGLGVLVGLALGVPAFANAQWSFPACDGFTVQAASGLAILAVVPLALGLLTPRLTSVRSRFAAMVVMSATALLIVCLRSPACLSPYGQVPIPLRRLWLDHVGEAQSAFAAPPAIVFGYCGVMLAGLAASAWMARRHPGRKTALLLVLQAAALLVTLVQLRGAYSGAMLGAPALAVMIGAARRRGTAWVVPAWIMSAGMVYPLAAAAFSPPAATRTISPSSSAEATSCATPAMITSLAHLPPGLVMAPIDTGAWGIAATPHHFVAGPYHRNIEGNLAMYRFFLGGTAQARAIASHWNVRYVLYCDGSMGAVRPAPGSMASALMTTRRAPPWLKPLDDRGHLFEVVR